MFGFLAGDCPGYCYGCESAEDGNCIVGPVARLWIGWLCGVGMIAGGDLSSEPGEIEGGAERCV